jgi:hypothetical protein
MARPSKNNAEYFPHYADLRNHRKIKVLRNRFGMVLGYAFWCLMLEWLTEHDGLEWEYSEMEIEMFASELGVSAAEIREMVDLCFKLQLLSLTSSNYVYSESLNEYLQPVFDKRERERDRSKQRKRSESGTYISGNILTGGVSAAEMPHSRVEKSKEENFNDIEEETIESNIKKELHDKVENYKKSRIKLTLEDARNIFINTDELKRVCIKKNEISEKEYFQAIEDFIDTQTAAAYEIKSETDVRKYFMNWLPLWKIKKEKERLSRPVNGKMSYLNDKYSQN